MVSSRLRASGICVGVTMLIIAVSAILWNESSATARDVDRPVMAYYYGWYTHDNWHSMRDFPPDIYDSWSDGVMRRQIEQAREVGIDAFICTWEFNCERLLEIAEEMGGFSVGFSVDPAAEHKLDTWDKFIDGMRQMESLVDSSAYLRWDGKPVFVFWNNEILPGDSGIEDFQRVRDITDPNHDHFWLGGGTDFDYLDVFDAIHYFDISWESRDGLAMTSYNNRLSAYNGSRGDSRPFVATVMPGYDDLLLRDGHSRARDNGEYYAATWNDAFRYDADAVVITSWNEWYEGSQIEPSETYGERYLEMTRDFVAEYRTRPGNFPDTGFEQTWARKDRPVAENRVNRTWTWGYVRRASVRERYNNMQRNVVYFDKSRMEINDPQGDRTSPWFVTNGLLALELITGRVQLGDQDFEQRTPASVNVAGDGDDRSGPTYATFQSLLDDPPLAEGTPITQRIDRTGSLPSDASLERYDATAAYHVPETDHRVASPFWRFMNSDGEIYDSGRFLRSDLFSDPFYVTGLPITEAYWTHVRVGEEPRDVLVQCFERRCLTYTPENPEGWRVEMGNVGQHYHQWRYGWGW